MVEKEKAPRLDPDHTVPVLEGVVSLTEAGEMLGYARQHAYRMARNGRFRSLARIGSSHMFVVSTKEIQEMLEQREQSAREEHTG